MKKIIIANWKMELSLKKSLNLLKEYNLKLKFDPKDKKLIICPDFLTLGYLSAQDERKRDFSFFLGAQTSGHLNFGPLTGEISAINLKKIGVSYVILGHSERRQVGESNGLIKDKILLALKANIVPIICLGEKKKGRAGISFIKKQLKEIFLDLPEIVKKPIIVAYEPVWAIGSNTPCSSLQAFKVSQVIKDFFLKYYQLEVKVVYGGSVNDKNAKNFLKQENIDGLLVGGASLSYIKLQKIINS